MKSWHKERYAAMYLFGIFSLCTAALESCNLFKTAGQTSAAMTSTAAQQTAISLEEEKNRYVAMASKFSSQDSSRNNYHITIWPRGSFNFSPEGGFTGEAEKVRVSGHAQAFGTAATALETTELDKGKMTATLKEQQKVSAATKEKKVVSSAWWIWAIAAVLATTACFYLIKYRTA